MICPRGLIQQINTAAQLKFQTAIRARPFCPKIANYSEHLINVFRSALTETYQSELGSFLLTRINQSIGDCSEMLF